MKLSGQIVALSWLVIASAASLSACDEEAASSATPSASATASTTGAADAGDRLGALLRAEVTRDVAAVTPEDVKSRDVKVRRAAARALARMRVPAARALLLHALRDPDEQVVAWAAYGLGDICAGARDETEAALVTAAAAHPERMQGGTSGADEAGDEHGAIAAGRAIVRAVGRCAGQQSQRILLGWAEARGPFADDAIWAIGDVAMLRKRLLEDTWVGLLTLAEGDAEQPPRPVALYPAGRVTNLPPSVVTRTREVATALLTKELKPTEAVFVVKALGRTDDGAIEPLASALASGPVAARAEAARSLTRFGRDGQETLGEALTKLLPADAPPDEATTHVLLQILAGLTFTRGVKPTLKTLTELPPPEGANDATRRSLSAIRCAAAELLAERDHQLPALRQCDLFVPSDASDPLPSTRGALAVVAALGLDAVKLTGPRLELWQRYAREAAPRVREAALAQLAVHAEVDAGEVVAVALEADAPGVVATAADFVAQHPGRVRTKDGVVPRIAAALAAQLEKGSDQDHETLASVMKAAATLKLPEATPAIRELCRSPWPALRARAGEALKLLDEAAGESCDAGPPQPAPVELDTLRTAAVTLVFVTDRGELSLRLDPTLAPVAVTRLATLAKNDFYDGIIVHRVVPGFVTQLGSPTADGYGGIEELRPLPCETSPIAFTPATVGIALAGRDTGSSQFFVTHVATPHLDGGYAQIGTATGAWESLVEGDRVTDVRVE